MKTNKWTYTDKHDEKQLESSIFSGSYEGRYPDTKNKYTFIVGCPNSSYRMLLLALNAVMTYPRASSDDIVIVGNIVGDGDETLETIGLVKRLKTKLKDRLTLVRGQTDQRFIYCRHSFFNSIQGKSVVQSYGPNNINQLLNDAKFLEDETVVFKELENDNLFISYAGPSLPEKPSTNYKEKDFLENSLMNLLFKVDDFIESKENFGRRYIYTCETTIEEELENMESDDRISLDLLPQYMDKIPVAVYNNNTQKFEEMIIVEGE